MPVVVIVVVWVVGIAVAGSLTTGRAGTTAIRAGLMVTVVVLMTVVTLILALLD